MSIVHASFDESGTLWMVSGAGVASYCANVFKHNTIPVVLTAFHYKLIQLICPVPLAFGPAGTGKTIALRCSLALLGAHDHQYASCCAECSIALILPTQMN